MKDKSDAHLITGRSYGDSLEVLWDIVKDVPEVRDEVKEWMDTYVETAHAAIYVDAHWSQDEDYLEYVHKQNIMRMGEAAAEEGHVWSRTPRHLQSDDSFHQLTLGDEYIYSMCFIRPKPKKSTEEDT